MANETPSPSLSNVGHLTAPFGHLLPTPRLDIGPYRSHCRSAMIEEFDLDGDGEISEQEFYAIMMDGE